MRIAHRDSLDCSLARSVAVDGRVEQLKLRQGHRNVKDFPGMYRSAILECHEEGSGGGMTSGLPQIAWPH
eukprot:365690-Chlamydomonas_euryale.AAC.2